MWFDEGESGSRKNRGHASHQATINELRLREIGKLGWANDASGGRQKRVLDDRAKQRAGGEIAGSALGQGQEILQAEGARASLERCVPSADRDAAAVNFCEDESGCVRHLYLGVEAGVLEVATSLDEARNDCGVFAEGSGEDWGSKRGDGRLMRIEQNQAASNQQAGDQLAAGGRVGIRRGVGIPEGGDDGGGVRPIE